MELLKAVPHESLSLHHVKHGDSDEKNKELARSRLIDIWQQHGDMYVAEAIADEPTEYGHDVTMRSEWLNNVA